MDPSPHPIAATWLGHHAVLLGTHLSMHGRGDVGEGLKKDTGWISDIPFWSSLVIEYAIKHDGQVDWCESSFLGGSSHRTNLRIDLIDCCGLYGLRSPEYVITSAIRAWHNSLYAPTM